MSQITNDIEFRKAIEAVDPVQQRVLASRFVEHVMSLSTDNRVDQVMAIAANTNASREELAGALKTARAATMDSHTRCGSEGNWTEQAGYFVCRAAVAALTAPEQTRSGSPAWESALACRMAQTSVMIDESSDEVPMHKESEWQYSILTDYLNS